LDDARTATYAAATTANANFQVAYEAKVTETNGLHAGLKSALGTRVSDRKGRLEEARRISREIVSDVQKAANEAANSAREAAATAEEVTRTVMLEIRPTYSECMITMGKLTSASQQAASFTGALDSCANGANLLAFQMIGVGNTCSAGLGPCNDVQSKRDEARPESSIISGHVDSGSLAMSLVTVNMWAANGHMSECQTAATKAADAANSALGDVRAAEQDQRNGEIYYEAAARAMDEEVSTYAPYLDSELPLMQVEYGLATNRRYLATEQSIIDACAAAVQAANDCTRPSLESTCSTRLGTAGPYEVMVRSYEASKQTAQKVRDDAKAAYDRAKSASDTAWAAAQAASAHTTDTKARAEASRDDAKEGKEEAERQKKLMEDRKKKQEEEKKKLEDAEKAADAAKDKVSHTHNITCHTELLPRRLLNRFQDQGQTERGRQARRRFCRMSSRNPDQNACNPTAFQFEPKPYGIVHWLCRPKPLKLSPQLWRFRIFPILFWQ